VLVEVVPVMEGCSPPTLRRRCLVERIWNSAPSRFRCASARRDTVQYLSRRHFSIPMSRVAGQLLHFGDGRSCSQVSPLYQAVKVEFAPKQGRNYMAQISTLTSPGACETSEQSLRQTEAYPIVKTIRDEN
jgi:hypothetical protein